MQVQRVANKEVKIADLLNFTKDQDYFVAWYGGLKKNPVAASVPNVTVFLRKLENSKPAGWREIKLALTHLGPLRLGSIWRNGERHSQIHYESKDFVVDFTEGEWEFISPLREMDLGKGSPIDRQTYELKYQQDRNWLIKFQLSSGQKLLIPCLEFFMRCYGESLEVNRVLAAYPWPEAENRLYDTSYQEPKDGNWHVKLRHRMRKGDVVLLAHLKYDPKARNKAKSIYSQIATEIMEKSIAFPKIGPWFQGKAIIRVEGLWIDRSNTFLGLRVTGCSDPAGDTIVRTREEMPKTSGGFPIEGTAIRTYPTKRISLGEIIDVTTENEPDNPSAWITVRGDNFAVLGEPRKVIDQRTSSDSDGEIRVPSSSEEEVSNISAGEPCGTGNNVGSSLGYEERVLESKGMLRDMWNALLSLSQDSEAITSVGWYSPETGLASSLEPKCVSLKARPSTNDCPSKAKANWALMEDNRPRGALIMFAETISTANVKRRIFILEIERRSRWVKKSDRLVATEEPYKGLAFVPNDDNTLADTVSWLLPKVVEVKGIVQGLVKDFHGRACAFMHTTSENEKILCKHTVKRVLRSMGVEI